MARSNAQNTSSRGEYLRQLREASGLKQAEVAARLGVQPSVLSRKETGSLPLTDADYHQIYGTILEMRAERNATFDRLQKGKAVSA